MIEVIFTDGSQLNLGGDARLAIDAEGASIGQSLSLLEGVLTLDQAVARYGAIFEGNAGAIGDDGGMMNSIITVI